MPVIVAANQGCRVVEQGKRLAVMFADGHTEYITLDPAQATVQVEGQWWYRGRYTLLQEQEGTRIRLEVYNIAKSFRCVAACMTAFDRKSHEAKFQALTHSLVAASDLSHQAL